MFRLCNIFKIGDVITDLVQGSQGRVYVTSAGDRATTKVITLMEESKMQNLKCFDISGVPEGLLLIREVGEKLVALTADSNTLVIAQGIETGVK